MKFKKYLPILSICFLLTGCGESSNNNELLNTISMINESRSDKFSDSEGEEYDFNEWVKPSENIFSQSEIEDFLELNSDYSNGYYINSPYNDYSPDKTLSKTAAKQDVEYLFKIFKHSYGAYEYFGGDNVFLEIKQNILESIHNDIISAQDLSDILVANLNFLADSHLSFSGNEMENFNSSKLKSFLISSTKYLKDDTGYYKMFDSSNADSRDYISRIDGNDNIEMFMRTTICDDGTLAYVISKLHFLSDSRIDMDVEYNNDSSNIKSEILTFSSRPLPMSEKGFEFTKKSGIPYLKLSRLYNISENDTSMENFIDSAKKIRKEKVAILDLRCNGGGLEKPTLEWIESYLGSSSDIRGRLFKKTSALITRLSADAPKSDTFFSAVYGLDKLSSNKDKFLFVLVDKMTVSAGEMFIENLMGIENVIVIGSNTFGKLRAIEIFPYHLENSSINISLGSNLYFPCFDEYEDFIGIQPDIIVNDSYILEKTIKMIKHYRIK